MVVAKFKGHTPCQNDQVKQERKSKITPSPNTTLHRSLNNSTRTPMMFKPQPCKQTGTKMCAPPENNSSQQKKTTTYTNYTSYDCQLKLARSMCRCVSLKPMGQSFGGKIKKPRGHKSHKGHIVLGASSENPEVTKVTKVTQFWGLAQKTQRSQRLQRSHSFGDQLRKSRGHKGHIVFGAGPENTEVTKVTQFWGLAQKTQRSQRSQRSKRSQRSHSFGGWPR